MNDALQRVLDEISRSVDPDHVGHAISLLEDSLRAEFGCLPLREPPVPQACDPYLYLFTNHYHPPVRRVLSLPRGPGHDRLAQRFLAGN